MVELERTEDALAIGEPGADDLSAALDDRTLDRVPILIALFLAAALLALGALPAADLRLITPFGLALGRHRIELLGAGALLLASALVALTLG